MLTIDPGICFIPQLIGRWRSEGRRAEHIDYDELDKWRDCGGVRHEEDDLITADATRRLGPRKPQTVGEMEALSRS